jgi:hypothetical protein
MPDQQTARVVGAGRALVRARTPTPQFTDDTVPTSTPKPKASLPPAVASAPPADPADLSNTSWATWTTTTHRSATASPATTRSSFSTARARPQPMGPHRASGAGLMAVPSTKLSGTASMVPATTIHGADNAPVSQIITRPGVRARGGGSPRSARLDHGPRALRRPRIASGLREPRVTGSTPLASACSRPAGQTRLYPAACREGVHIAFRSAQREACPRASLIVRHGASGRFAHCSWEPGRQPWRVCLFGPDGAWRSRCRWDAQSAAVMARNCSRCWRVIRRRLPTLR